MSEVQLLHQYDNIIGYWMSDKKSHKLNWAEFAKVCRNHGYDLVKINLDVPLETQGPFTVVLHKLTDIIAKTVQGDQKAVAMLDRVEEYIRGHPEVAVIDPLDNVRKLLDRYCSYRVIHDSDLETIDVFTPTFVELTSHDVAVNIETLQAAGVSFPFVCKPSVAHGTNDCHKMAVIFNEIGVADCNPPCVAQSFVNHNANLYKLYVLGEEYYLVERPSLKNFQACNDRPTIFFDSHDVSKSDSSSALSILDEGEGEKGRGADPEKLTRIVATLRQALGMALLGIDVVVENTTGRHAIIDINAYPGYDGFPDFFDSLMRCIEKTVNDHRSLRWSGDQLLMQEAPSMQSPSQTQCQPVVETVVPTDQEDSGFETADSSDEKKRKQRLRGAGERGLPASAMVTNKKCLERQV